MRKISIKARDAFMSGQTFKSSNTEVTRNREMLLHGNKIAWFDNNNNLWLSACGWRTATTKERLNSLPNVSIVQKKGDWYLNGKYWNGYPIRLNKF